MKKSKPFGYRDKREKRLLEQMAEWKAKYHTYAEIAEKANAAGRSTPTGKAWTAKNVENALARYAERAARRKRPQQEDPTPAAQPSATLKVQLPLTPAPDTVETQDVRQAEAIQQLYRDEGGKDDEPIRFGLLMNGGVSKSTNVGMWFTGARTGEPVTERDRGGWWVADQTKVESIFRQLAAVADRDVHKLLDAVEGMPGVKGPLRRAVNLLVGQLALMLQNEVALRQRLIEAQREGPLPWKHRAWTSHWGWQWARDPEYCGLVFDQQGRPHPTDPKAKAEWEVSADV